MKTIPHDLATALKSLGVSDVVFWNRLSDISVPAHYRVTHVCQCSFRQVPLKPFTLRDRSIMLGQCSRCKVVHWGEWVSREEPISADRDAWRRPLRES